QFETGGAFDSIAETRVAPSASDTPWLYTSWAAGLKQLTLPLLGEGDEPANYTIRLHFAEARTDAKEPAVVDVQFNGKEVVSGLSLTPAPDVDSVIKPVVREIRNVPIERDLLIQLRAQHGTPVLNAIEAIREPAAK
ncbi:MAG: malectin domain-containing carbohydrate-binding protein, partial [Desulfobacterales bacterium]|nr:malectin domain-containing carbohydrate-binding protein [Desulfobacterales bacterium]